MREANTSSRIATGLLLVVIGALLLVENFTDWNFRFSDWWPALLVVIGIANLFRRRSGRWFWGAVTLVGAVFLLDSLGVWSVSMRDVWRLWPLILLVIGARFLFGHRRRRASRREESGTTESVDTSEINVSCGFGATEQRVTSRNFSGGAVSAIFGGATIDLTDAGLAVSSPTVDVSAVFGGVTFVVPEDWSVDIRTTNLFGGSSDGRRKAPSGAGPTLTITGTCMFGGVNIESP